MCGIFGIYLVNKDESVNETMVKEATDTMIHRGPDGSGLFISGNIGLGHRRLSIIDISGGKQPMFNEDGQIALIYNGEIYNFKGIREFLLSKGHAFITNSDSEVIIHAYEEWGETCVEKFRGMFAFAIWDSRRNSLFLARDRLGIKPLYYVFNNKMLVFGSEIKAILKTGVVDSSVNMSALDAYFTLGYVPGEETLFKHIVKLAPGHTLLLRDGCLSIKQYWDLPVGETTETPFQTCKEELYHLLYESVQLRLMSDVPLGVFLSGGLDSSAVVAMMHQMVEEPVKTFSVGYRYSENENELGYAAVIADKFQTDHHSFILEPENFLNSIDILLHHTEEPIVEPAAVALYHIAKMCKSKATVVLSGEGGDEGFAGYHLYSIFSRIETIKQKMPFSAGLKSCRFGRWERIYKYLDWLTLPVNDTYRGISADLTQSFKPVMYTKDFYHHKGNYLDTVFESYFKQTQGADILSKLLYVDAKTWLVDDLLLKADKMTMGASVELRVPFLDHKLMEFATRLPSHYKLYKKQGKYILKKSMEHRLPHHIIYRKKMGFPVPINQWFGKELYLHAKDILLSSKSIQRGYIHLDYIKRLFKSQETGKGRSGRRIFSLLNLELWHRKYIDS